MITRVSANASNSNLDAFHALGAGGSGELMELMYGLIVSGVGKNVFAVFQLADPRLLNVRQVLSLLGVPWHTFVYATTPEGVALDPTSRASREPDVIYTPNLERMYMHNRMQNVDAIFETLNSYKSRYLRTKALDRPSTVMGRLVMNYQISPVYYTAMGHGLSETETHAVYQFRKSEMSVRGITQKMLVDYYEADVVKSKSRHHYNLRIAKDHAKLLHLGIEERHVQIMLSTRVDAASEHTEFIMLLQMIAGYMNIDTLVTNYAEKLHIQGMVGKDFLIMNYVRVYLSLAKSHHVRLPMMFAQAHCISGYPLNYDTMRPTHGKAIGALYSSRRSLVSKLVSALFANVPSSPDDPLFMMVTGITH